jgi:hypothetical protein
MEGAKPVASLLLAVRFSRPLGFRIAINRQGSTRKSACATKTSRCDRLPTSLPRPEEWSRPSPTKRATPDRPPGPTRQTWSRRSFAACLYCKLDGAVKNISALEVQQREGSRRLTLAERCNAGLQIGILESTGCPPEGGRYTNRNRVLTINSTCLLDLLDLINSICWAAFASCPRRFPEIPSFRNTRRVFRPWDLSSADTLL